MLVAGPECVTDCRSAESRADRVEEDHMTSRLIPAFMILMHRVVQSGRFVGRAMFGSLGSICLISAKPGVSLQQVCKGGVGAQQVLCR